MCFVRIWEQTANISLYSDNWLVFITETVCVYCAVRTGVEIYLVLFFKKIMVNLKSFFSHFFVSIIYGPGWLSRYSDSLRTGCSGNRIPLVSDIFRTFPDRPWGPPSLLYDAYWLSFLGGKSDRASPSSAKVKEVVKLYFYSPSLPSFYSLNFFFRNPYHLWYNEEKIWERRTGHIWQYKRTHKFRVLDT